MFLCKFLLFSVWFCFVQAYPANTDQVLSKSDDSNKYNEKISDIFDIPNYATNEPTIITNCDNVICISYSLCINDKVVNNGSQLFDWRLSPRTTGRIPGELVECDDMEVPCCADKAIKDLHPPAPDHDHNEYNSTEDHEEGDNKFVKSTQKCGYSKFTSSQKTSAEQMRPNESPWMVAIFFLLPTGKLQYLGSGSLIHESVILTVAHLLLKFTPEQLVIRA
ncbi:uncharacterized protein LOC116340014, partial [Contarinia nasturtii]|uniref:uncharacterized protein LOC116340014 n=1 Tax=Contarinia nasturtii TaxID=265458 RepID=UPI0012D49A30